VHFGLSHLAFHVGMHGHTHAEAEFVRREQDVKERKVTRIILKSEFSEINLPPGKV
jgi:hypothetical protein